MSASATQGGHSKSSAVAEMGDRGHNRHGPTRGGAAVPLSRGSWVPVSLIHCGRGRDLLPYQVASSSIQPFGHNRLEPKTGAVPLLRGSCDPCRPYLRTKWHLDPSSRFATIDMGQKLGGVGVGVPSFWGSWVPIEHTVSPGPRSTSIPSGVLVHPAIWPERTLAENWGLCPFGRGGAGSSFNTMSRRPKPTSVPSGILIHAAVWPQ